MNRYLSANYVERFRCDGVACGARCCRGWSIGLTDADRRRLSQALTRATGMKNPCSLTVESRGKKAQKSLHTYRIRFDENGKCPYLRDDQNCEVHATIGEQALPDICSQYPREVNVIGSTSEVWATLACPEAARVCLFSATGADCVELEDVSNIRHINNVLEITEQTSDYYAYLDEVRRGIVSVLKKKELPLRTRLFAIAYLGHRTASYFHSKATTVDRSRLKADLASVSELSFLRSLSKELESNSVPGNYAVSLITSVLENGSDSNPIASESPEQLGSMESQSLQITTEKWLQTWLEFSLNRLRWEKDFADTVEIAFENYCKVFWMKDWYIHSPNLLVHAVACILRVAVMRYRLFNSERLTEVVESEGETAKKRIFETVLLDVVADTTRMIDHDNGFRKSLHAALAKRKMEDLAHACILLMI